jgi:hypothetical protein
MKLVLQRSQKSGMMGMGKIIFGLDARAQLTDAESEHVKKYKMGREILYRKEKVDTSGIQGMGIMAGIGTALAARALNLTISVDDLVKGKHIECKDIVEMRAAEEQLREACALFKEILESAAHFEGEEVVEY